MDREDMNLIDAYEPIDDTVRWMDTSRTNGFSNSGTARPDSGKVTNRSVAAISWATTTDA